MIIEFSIKNFRSFRELATLSFEAAPLKISKSCLISPDTKLELLPAIGIFGHNASGKSNLVKALVYMQWAMLNSDYLNQPTNKNPLLEPFLLNMKSRKDPSYFQVVLWDSENKAEYRYGFEVNAEHVVSEWLEVTSKVKVKRSTRMIFIRKGQEFLDLDDGIKTTVGHLLLNVRPSALALTVFAQFADPTSSQVIKLMNRSNLMIIDGGAADRTMAYALQQYHEKPQFASRVLRLIKKLDLSIQDLQVTREPITELQRKSIPNELQSLLNQQTNFLRAITLHKMYGTSGKEHKVEFDLHKHESTGTQRLFVLATLLLQSLESGGVFVLDELGASIHPFMSSAIVQLFQKHTTNTKGAQLIFCSHETYLMSNPVGLRQDQICFTEKNAQEETQLHSLREYNIRSESEFEKIYRQGRLGAVPMTWPEVVDD